MHSGGILGIDEVAAKMRGRLKRMLSGSPVCWPMKPVKRHEQDVEQLEKYLYHLINILKEEIMKQLVRGRTPAGECDAWLNQEKKIGSGYEPTNELEYRSFKLHLNQDEIVKCLASYPSDHGLSIASPHGTRPRPRRTRRKAYRPVKEASRTRYLSKAKEKLEVGGGKAEIIPWQPKKSETGLIARMDSLTPPVMDSVGAILPEHEKQIEVGSTSSMKGLSMLDLDIVHEIVPERQERTEEGEQMEIGSMTKAEITEPAASTALIGEAVGEMVPLQATKIFLVREKEIDVGPSASRRSVPTHEPEAAGIVHGTSETTEESDQIKTGPSAEVEVTPASTAAKAKAGVEMMPLQGTKILNQSEKEMEIVPSSSPNESYISEGVGTTTGKTEEGGGRSSRISAPKEVMLELPTAKPSFTVRIFKMFKKRPRKPAAKSSFEKKKPTKTTEEKAEMSDTEPAIQNYKSSYNHLKALGNNRGLRASDLQACFLYCALLAEDQMVNKSEQIDHWIQEYLIAGSGIDALEKGNEIIKILTEEALLETDEGSLCIKMPETVRDFALKMLLQEIEAGQFLVKADSRLMQPPNVETSSSSVSVYRCLLNAGEVLTKVPAENEWKEAKIVFLKDSKLSDLPQIPNCPDLSMLSLQGCHSLRVIPEPFFVSMPSLRVLKLSKSRITSLPKSISKLASLKELFLTECDCLYELRPEVGELKCLHAIDLRGTDIYQLPKEIGKLPSLKHLQVSFYGPVEHRGYSKLPSELIPRNIISRLHSLSNLSVGVQRGDQRWDKNSEYVLIDICKLKNLNALHFRFPKVELLQFFVERSLSWNTDKIEKFNFIVGHDVKRMLPRVPKNVELDYVQSDRCLRLVNYDDETIPEAIQKVLVRATAFYLDHLLKIRSLSGFKDGETKLEFCVIRECPEIGTIFECKNEVTFPHLEHLSIHYLEGLKTIWSGLKTGMSFGSLKYLRVHTCPQLKYILTNSTSHHIHNLEELTVEDCRGIEEIIFCDTDDKVGDVLLPKLKSLSLKYLPKLSRIWKGSWPTLMDIGIYDCSKLRNLYMGLNSGLMKSIKRIEAEQQWWSELQWDDISFPLSQNLPVTFIQGKI